MPAGVVKVIIEARDAGRNIGIYDDQAAPGYIFRRNSSITSFTLNDVIWEAPLSAQQQALLDTHWAQRELWQRPARPMSFLWKQCVSVCGVIRFDFVRRKSCPVREEFIRLYRRLPKLRESLEELSDDACESVEVATCMKVVARRRR